MELNYLILAHKNPLQVKRLISRLCGKNTNFYVHVDLQTDLKQFEKEISLPEVTFINERFNCQWGDIGIVNATLSGMREIIKSGNKGYCILLSGQDYPLKSNTEIQTFLYNKFPIDFMTVYPIPHSGWQSGGLDRLKKYKFQKTSQRKHYFQIASIFHKDFYNLETLGKLNFLKKSKKYSEMALVLKSRNFPSYLKPYGGSQWWGLTIETIKDIIDYLDTHPDYLEYHQYTLIPDEIFFQSILMHLQRVQPGKRKIERSFTYVNWERPNTPLPITFDRNDFKELKTAAKSNLFARKFDIKLDKCILNEIDKKLL